MKRFGWLLALTLTGCGEVLELGLPDVTAQSLARFDIPYATPGNRVSLHVDGPNAFPALERLIQTARRSLYIETFIWHDDATGKRIAHLLIDAQRRGVDVRILVDSLGLRMSSGGPKDVQMITWMRQQGLNVREFNPLVLNHRGLPVTHRKLYIADGQRFLSGGINIGDEYANGWHDLLFEVHGQAAGLVALEFSYNWKFTTGEELAVEPARPEGNATVGIIVTDPHRKRYDLRETTLRLLGEAKKSIRLIMPYFSDDELIGGLKAAAKRGVQVQVILPVSNDERTFGYINSAETVDLLTAGVQVRFYHGAQIEGRFVERFSHVKFLMVDDEIASVGSANGDRRTMVANHELNALIRDPGFIEEAHRELWGPDWAQSREASLLELEKRSTKEKVFGAVLRGIDRFL